MTINGFLSFLKRRFLLIIIIFVLIFSYGLFQTNKSIRENIFYFIETNIFYIDIPPVYTDKSFKTMEPNKVCGLLNNASIIGGAYSRSKYFDFACESNTLVAADSSWSIQFIGTGKLFNLDTLVLRMDFLKNNNNNDKVKVMAEFVNHLFIGLGYGKMPERLNNNLFTLNNSDYTISDDIKVKILHTDESISLILN